MKKLLLTLFLVSGIGFTYAQEKAVPTIKENINVNHPIKGNANHHIEKQIAPNKVNEAAEANKIREAKIKQAKEDHQKIKEATSKDNLKKEAKSTTEHLKKDGTPDKRYKSSNHLKKDGTPDKRFKENK